jgi:SAM-dependent methyltransferase
MIAGPPRDAAVGAAYDSRAAEYIALAGGVEQLASADREEIEAWAGTVRGRILDAGCGPGLWTRHLHDGGHEVLGLDMSERFVAHARAHHPGVAFRHGTFAEVPAQDAAFGGILAWYSLIHIPPSDVAGILGEFARVLAPGGSLLIGFFDGTPREAFAHAVAPAYYWSPEALGELMTEAGFEITDGSRRERQPGEASVRPHASVTAVRRR